MWREWFNPEAVRRVGSTPDYRFSLANERTFLAWLRTGLALVAGGLVVAQFLPELRIPLVREALAIVLLVLGGTVTIRGLNHWVRCEKAIRQGHDLPESRFPAMLAVGVAAGAALLVMIVVIEGLTG
ncbi:DUF202 domain-containing protein [Natronosporangium hydrolyticum]|uniref:DUF202 domain-containing protein n=1 Tax=Natronosporangium hydrolyticum TaxID=2811111 RepID=A0A895Y7F3_9ACTN|nr:DUF202 domain-containing protein [Natronosporangium hydrolyticum]QSB13664.1 DUF202 domain-containing protein [Natronosporangium hydrolyticum]